MAKQEREESCSLRLHDGAGGVASFDRSPGFVFVMMARSFGGEAHRLSRLTNDWNGRVALEHAVRYGFRFDADDAQTVGGDERIYAIACNSERGFENRSFAQSYEKWIGRKPFLVRDHDSKTPTRMYVGREFRWYGERVWCKSFNDDKGYFNAVQYDKHPNNYNPKVTKRFRITHDDIKAYHAHLDGKEPAKGKTRAA